MRRSVLLFLAMLSLAAPLGAHAEGHAKKSKPTYLPLDTLSATVRNFNGHRGVLTVEVGLDAPDPALRDRLELYQPLLRSAYVSALQPYALSLNPGAPPNADYISLTLQRETDRVLGGRGAKLLIGSILIN